MRTARGAGSGIGGLRGNGSADSLEQPHSPLESGTLESPREFNRLLNERKSLCGPGGFEQTLSVIAEADSEPGEVTEIAADALFLAVQRHRSIQVAADMENVGLVAERSLKALEVPELATDALLPLQ